MAAIFQQQNIKIQHSSLAVETKRSENVHLKFPDKYGCHWQMYKHENGDKILRENEHKFYLDIYIENTFDDDDDDDNDNKKKMG